MKLTRKAHAKLNLFLEVTGKLANGYHELYSLVVFLDLADEITVETAPTITVAEHGVDSGITDNIIYRTADKLAKKYNVKTGARITFVKNIPIGGGLGGGSSDAAATMVLLNKLWRLQMQPAEMYKIALELGADVPVCVYSIIENKSSAFFSGIGEIIAPAPKLPKMFFTLVNPGTPLVTKDVFNNFAYEGLRYEKFKTKGDFFKNISQRSNDLEPAAIALLPPIAIALRELKDSPNCLLARMTGSGATSFGIFKKQGDSRAAAVKIIKNQPGWMIGPVGLKNISSYSSWQKKRRKLLYRRISLLRTLRDSKFSRELNAIFTLLRIKIRWGRAATYSLLIHALILLLYDASFVTRNFTTPPEFITVAFAVENTPPPEAAIETAAGEQPEETQVQETPLPPQKPKSQPAAKKKPVAAHKLAPKKLAARPGLLNAPVKEHSVAAPKVAPRDYLELLQYTVQERSAVPKYDPNLRGKAVLELVFNRQGYVLAYKLKQKTGQKTLDQAVDTLAKNLMDNPLPATPNDFDQGEEILQYDFSVSYPAKAKS